MPHYVKTMLENSSLTFFFTHCYECIVVGIGHFGKIPCCLVKMRVRHLCHVFCKNNIKLIQVQLISGFVKVNQLSAGDL